MTATVQGPTSDSMQLSGCIGDAIPNQPLGDFVPLAKEHQFPATGGPAKVILPEYAS